MTDIHGGAKSERVTITLTGAPSGDRQLSVAVEHAKRYFHTLSLLAPDEGEVSAWVEHYERGEDGKYRWIGTDPSPNGPTGERP